MSNGHGIRVKVEKFDYKESMGHVHIQRLINQSIKQLEDSHHNNTIDSVDTMFDTVERKYIVVIKYYNGSTD